MKKILSYAIVLLAGLSIGYLFWGDRKEVDFSNETITGWPTSSSSGISFKVSKISLDSAKMLFNNYKLSLAGENYPKRACNYDTALYCTHLPKGDFQIHFRIKESDLFKAANAPENFTGMRVYMCLDKTDKVTPEKYILSYTINKNGIEYFDSEQHLYLLNAKLNWCGLVHLHKILSTAPKPVEILTHVLCHPDCPKQGAILL